MKNVKVFTAVCAAVVIAFMSANYSMAKEINSTINIDTVMAMNSGAHHGNGMGDGSHNGAGTHNGTGGKHNGTGTGSCRK